VTTSIVEPSQQTAPASVVANYTSTSPAQVTAVPKTCPTSSAGAVPLNAGQVKGQVAMLIVILSRTLSFAVPLSAWTDRRFLVFCAFLMTIRKFGRPDLRSRERFARPSATLVAAPRAPPRTDSMATAVEMQPTRRGVRSRSSVLAMPRRSESTLVDTPPAPRAPSANAIISTMVYPPSRILEVEAFSDEPEEMDDSTT
jgi:hypothetical protein